MRMERNERPDGAPPHPRGRSVRRSNVRGLRATMEHEGPRPHHPRVGSGEGAGGGGVSVLQRKGARLSTGMWLLRCQEPEGWRGGWPPRSRRGRRENRNGRSVYALASSRSRIGLASGVTRRRGKLYAVQESAGRSHYFPWD